LFKRWIPTSWTSGGTSVARPAAALLGLPLVLTLAACGGSSNTITLTAPTIESQPSNVTVRSTQSASFVVSAKGTPDPSYQWRKGGVDIPGATGATLLIGSTRLSDAGTFSVLVKNSQGSVLSASATLTVQASMLFADPTGVGVDGVGNIYVANGADHTVCKVTPAGVLTVLAGASGQAGTTDGPGATARFTWPTSLAVTAGGTVYVGEGSNTIRVISPAGVVSTLAGSPGLAGSANGTGSSARFGGLIQGLALDAAGNLLVADSYNHLLRQVTPAGVVTTLAGQAGVAGATDGALGVGLLNQPCGVAVGPTGTIYIADFANDTIRTLVAGSLSTLAGTAATAGTTDGTGAAARFDGPVGLVIDGSGKLYVAEAHNQTIRKIDTGAVVTTLAGGAGTTGNLDGTGTSARFTRPTGLAVNPGGSLVVADAGNGTLRKILLATAEVTTYLAP
jgi:sugar lactone lactonase YvrE